jgi:hypothetical protein
MAPLSPPANKEIDLVGAAVAPGDRTRSGRTRSGRTAAAAGPPESPAPIIAEEYRVPEHLPLPHNVERVGAIRLHAACLQAGREVIG